MAETILSVNVGLPTQVPYQGKLISTGIFKHPVDGPEVVRRGGIEGDGQADLSVHGGEHKAVYIYSADNYAWWATELGHELQPGEFGENLTVTGFGDDDVSVGDELIVGSARVQVTGPREPCFKLGIRMGDHRFPARFREAARLGFYVRVINEGFVAPNDEITVAARANDSVTIAKFHDLYVNNRDDVAALMRLAAAPGLDPSWIAWCDKRILDASGSSSND